jgi:hypothetical protein
MATRTAKRPSWSIRSAANWFDTVPLTGAAVAVSSGAWRSRARIATITRVAAGTSVPVSRGFTITQNWPPAVASSVASGSVQIATS